MAEKLPTRIDRAAIERVIQRAAELQTGERDIGDALTPDEVVSLGREVGIPERYLRQALLEEQGRTSLPAPAGLIDWSLGQAGVQAARVVRGEPDVLEQALLRWMDNHELLAVQRQQAGRISWEPDQSLQATLKRAFTSRTQCMLARATTVTAIFTPLEPGYCHVSLAADLHQARGRSLSGAMVLLASGVLGTGAVALMSPFLIVAALPLAVGAGLAALTGRSFRPVSARALLGLERALDHLERGAVKLAHAIPPGEGGLLGTVLNEVRKALNPSP